MSPYYTESDSGWKPSSIPGNPPPYRLSIQIYTFWHPMSNTPFRKNSSLGQTCQNPDLPSTSTPTPSTKNTKAWVMMDGFCVLKHPLPFLRFKIAAPIFTTCLQPRTLLETRPRNIRDGHWRIDPTFAWIFTLFVPIPALTAFHTFLFHSLLLCGRWIFSSLPAKRSYLDGAMDLAISMIFDSDSAAPAPESTSPQPPLALPRFPGETKHHSSA